MQMLRYLLSPMVLVHKFRLTLRNLFLLMLRILHMLLMLLFLMMMLRHVHLRMRLIVMLKNLRNGVSCFSNVLAWVIKSSDVLNHIFNQVYQLLQVFIWIIESTSCFKLDHSAIFSMRYNQQRHGLNFSYKRVLNLCLYKKLNFMLSNVIVVFV